MRLGQIGLGFGYTIPDTADISNGVVSGIEQAIANKLASLLHNGAAVFRTAEPWNYQIAAGEGGVEAFSRYTPFAFVRYSPPQQAGREGDGDLKQVLQFAVVIGTESKERGVARIGSETILGISKIKDYVIAALDNWHPGDGFGCDPLYFETEDIMFESPRRHALAMFFQANLIKD